MKAIAEAVEDAAEAVGKFVSDAAAYGTNWFSSTTGAGTSFASWLAGNIQSLVDGTITSDAALISLAKHLGQDYITGFVGSQVGSTAAAQGVIAKVFNENFGMSKEAAGAYAGAVATSLQRIAVDFALNGFNTDQLAKAAMTTISAQIAATYIAQQGWSPAVSTATTNAITTAVSTLISGGFNGNWAQLGVQVGLAAISGAAGAQIGALIGGSLAGPAGIVAAAVVSFIGGKLLGNIFGGGKEHFGSGEFKSPEQLFSTIYQVQTITVDGQQVPALVAVNARGSTIVASGSNIGYVVGNTGADVLVGSETVQTIIGNNGADYLEARGGDDNLLGGNGNDILNGGDGKDILQGDAGGDIIFGEESNDTILGGAGDDFIHLGTGDDIASGGDGNDYILAAGGDDAVSGDAGNDTIDGGYGDDTIDGGAGGDLILGNLGNDSINGGDSGDTIFGDVGNDSIDAGNGNDFIDGGDGMDILHGDAGRDMMVGGVGDDLVDGGIGDDNIVGGNGNDVILGGLDNDYLRGDAGNDTITGGMGNDIIVGGTGVNTLQGNEGNDVYVIGSDVAEHDTIIQEDGGVADTDTILLSWLTSVNAQTGLTLTKSGSDLAVAYSGRTLATVQDQFVAGHSVEKIELSTGVYVDLNDVTYDAAAGLGTFTISSNTAGSVAGNVVLREQETNSNLLNKQYYWNDTFLSKLSQQAYNEQLNDQTVYTYYNGSAYESFRRGSGGIWGHRYTVYKLATPGNIDGTDFVKLQYAVADAEDQSAASPFGNHLTGLPGPYDSIINGAKIVYSTFAGKNIQDIEVNGTVVSTKVAGDAANYVAGATLYGATYAQRLAAGSSVISDVAVKKDGSDLLVGAYWGETINGKSGDDVLVGNDGNDNLIGGDGNDWLLGGDGNDTHNGGNGDDTMLGGDGADNFLGGAGDDMIIADDGSDTVSGDLGNDWIDGGNGNDSILGGDGNDVILGGVGIDTLDGGNGNDVIQGNEGNDILIGGAGDDTLIGGHGNDSLYGGIGNDVLNGDGGAVLLDGGAGIDTIIFTSTGSGFSANLQTNTYGGGATGLAITGFENVVASSYDDLIYSSASANTIDAGDGIDTVSYESSTLGVRVNLTTNVNSGGYAQSDKLSHIENIVGSAYNDTITGSSDNNVIYGNAGNDTMDGAAGADTLVGGLGNDVYALDASNDVVVENANEGTDLANSYASYTLSDNIEYLALLGTAAINGNGNGFNNILTGNSGNNILDGGAGVDTLRGGLGDDTYIVDASTDSVVELINQGNDTVLSSVNYVLTGYIENLTLTGTAAINATGTSLNNTLIGNSGSNILNGAAGNDTLAGGAGNDTYIIDAGDTVTEQANEGTDTIQSTLNYTLGDNIENLTLTANTAINGTGNALNNLLTGGVGNNILDGGLGNDTLVGGIGSDTYIVDAVGDVVTEALNQGIDVVQTAVTYTLGDNVENMLLTGTNAINGTGNALNNLLIGNSGNNILNGSAGGDILDGGLGADTLIGGVANDTYYADSSDTILENLSEGTDVIISSGSFTLSNNIENLTLTEAASASSATGNSLVNTLVGNSANNIIDGGAGADVMRGGAGNDTYITDVVNEAVVENANEGIDTVLSSATYTLGTNVENLTLTGAAVINGTGNALDNYIIGNSANNILTGAAGNDTLDGGLGNDALKGGLGDDTYYVDVAGDVITENANEGSDTVVISTTYTVGANLENIALVGMGAINATGNSVDNILKGNVAANILDGGAGNDTLDGGAGNDTLRGGVGNDTYVIDAPGDVIVENAGEGTDTVQTTSNYTIAANLENLTLMGTEALNGTGNDTNNLIVGNVAANLLDGGLGDDTLHGGLGDDTYVLNSVGDVITENTGEGADTVLSTLDTVLGANLENLTLSGTAISGTGNELNNIITGNAGDNLLTGGLGVDTLAGGLGDDTYSADTNTDTIIENSNEGTDTVQSTASYALSNNLENLILSGSDAINGTGNALNNVITGNALSNILDGGAGNDTMTGGAGNDTYIVDSAGDKVIESSGLGNDTVLSLVNYELGIEVENLTLTGTGDTTATGNDDNNSLIGNSGNNTVYGGLGVDTMRGGLGNDTYWVDASDAVIENAGEGQDTIVSSLNYTLGDNIEALRLFGAHDINGTGNALDNLIFGNIGNNVLDGGTGVDTLSGGVGNDTYKVDSTTDTLIENADEGTDTVLSSVSYVLGNNIENLTLAGNITAAPLTMARALKAAFNTLAVKTLATTDSAINGTGNALNNVITGNAGDNILDGGAGVDTLIGGEGNDTYIASLDGDVITENAGEGTDTLLSQYSVSLVPYNNLENLTLIGAAISGTGNALDNVIQGNANDNILDGGTGVDTLIGGAGNDTYVASLDGDIIIENANEGSDILLSAFNVTLYDNLENLTLTGAAISGTGNALNNVIRGNTSNNILDGASGNDTLIGGLGDDSYAIDSTGDVIVENANEGTDTVLSAITCTLGNNLENLVLTGTSNINGIGNAQANIISGNAADNILDGGVGADTLRGGLGNDTYLVDGSDTVIENANEGTDTIVCAISYTLAANVENLTLTGTAGISATGNALNNRITGNASYNTLDGSLGDDTLTGGAGDDIYVVDSALDVIIEAANEGQDQVRSSATNYVLSANLENLYLQGTASIHGTGNALGNSLFGNAGNNLLDGGAGDDVLNGAAGVDTLIGGLGNDTYMVDNGGDVISENVGEGIDIVWSEAASYTLSDHVETLRLSGAAISGTGNALDNTLVGTAANNTLSGGAGNDTLDGGFGNDMLIGGAGNDTYYVDAVGDRITELANEGTDTVLSSVTFTLSGNLEHLTLAGVATANGTGDSGHNTITGNQASNVLTGAAGNDTLSGGLGNDTLNGGDGNDWLDGGRGTDSIDGGLGVDTVSYGGSLAAIDINMGNGAFFGGDAVNDILRNIENIVGSSFNDRMTGNTLSNGIAGGAGNDILAGGLGADFFIYQAISDSGIGAGKRDIITDFTRAQGDKIDLSALPGTFSFLGGAAFTGDATPQVRYGAEGANTILQIDTNGDRATDFEIQINGQIAFVSTDFVL